ncbi:SPW repeat domain-containing protein [Chelativorans salis]|uniref:NAD-dependent epimerase/dehydratase family protein n=1 Tax=Chelativorans salis TaxID=2978478 RepID=A0ABT2LSV7_9HYPH|nr:NAD-dependent epimerase/dehydratase family protein [Chelativorans sp. EGI FJ00035]MCT7377431.1 NAD-dependent epimerase/dehydratase family protein [Chelativorans sp. EGI FJ00035]
MNSRQDVVIVTGSSGFIGSTLVKKLADRFVPVGLDLFVPEHTPADAEYIHIDLTSDESVGQALGQVRERYGDRIASVIHLAAYFDLTGEPDPKYEAVTVRGTERLLRALQDFEVEQFVFSSTMLVHAPGKKGQPINEDWPLDPKLPYRASKIRTEKLIREQRGNIPAVLVRPAGVYDEMCRATFLAHQIARIHERLLVSHVYPGDLDTGQPFVHLDDLMDALLAVVERRKELPAELPLLIGETETPSFGELQKELGRLIHGEEWETRQIPKSIARTGSWVQGKVLDQDPFIRPWMVDISDDHYELDISRARKLLDWEPKHSLRQTLPRMIDALKADPAGWYKANKLNPASVAPEQVETEEREEEEKTDPEQHQAAMREHMQQMRMMHFDVLWVHFFNMLLGLWLATSPFVFGTFGTDTFSDAVMRVTEERGLWDPSLRSSLTAWSDLLSGILIVAFSAFALSPRFSWAPWANTAVGIWLLFAPLVFWAPSAAVYANDTFVGALVITFSILVPMMPGMSHEGMMDESDMPPGWTYCPSTYLQRLPIIALGAIGFVIARALAAYQLGHIDYVWEPFFAGEGDRNGTEFIITSDVSKAWPIADGGLGATSYMFEILMGVMGGRSRWRTMPWMVLLFGIVVVPLGVISIYFIIIQPIMIGTYCTLCLAAALAMLIMIPFALDELVAMGQFQLANTRRGHPFWRSFFMGDALPGSGKDTKRPGFDVPIGELVRSAARGVTVPWTLVASSVLGAWLMFSRLVFGTEPPMADSDHLVGALIITVAVMAMAEVGRPLRFINVAFGLWLIAAPWLLTGGGTLAAAHGVVTGLILIALSLPRGARSKEHYGSWDRYVF